MFQVAPYRWVFSLIFVTVCLIAIPSVSKSDFNFIEGFKAYEAGKFRQAHALFEISAQGGYVRAQAMLGSMYHDGLGAKQDFAKAFYWLSKAAEKSNPFAEVSIGIMYAMGRGVEKDEDEAVRRFRKAAMKGIPRGQVELGHMYLEGRGIQSDEIAAIYWYRKAAAQGDAMGQLHLGSMYLNGLGTSRDEAQAVHWLNKAVDKGNVDAMTLLAWVHATSLNSHYRDGLKAIKLASDAMKASDSPTTHDVLAAAFAATEDFVPAVRQQEIAISKAKMSGKSHDGMKKRLKLYRSGNALTCPGGPCD